MDIFKALQNFSNEIASEEEKQLLKQAHASGEISIGGNVVDSVVIAGPNNTVQVIQLTPEALDRLRALLLLKEDTIPSVEAVARHRVALRERLEENARIRWGFFYIQEEGVALPIEALPYKTEQSEAPTNLLAALKSARRMLVLGDPGSGKTVALEQLAQEACAGDEPLIPVILKLFKYDGKPLADWVWAHLQERGELQFKDNTALNAFLQGGSVRCVFLFDGLNEVAPEFRNDLTGELVRWMAAYPRHTVVITSRVQDELWRKLRAENSELLAMVVQPINNEQAREYLIKYLGDVNGDELYRRLDERLLALTCTPLVLWLIKEASLAGESLSSNRGELYQRFVERVLLRDKDRDMNGPFLERTKERALSTLALHISMTRRLTCPRREAVGVVAGAFEKDFSLDKAKALVDACVRHGLLAGEDELWFAPHQTVQEHFAAVALLETVRQDRNLSGVAWLGRNAQEIVTGKKSGLNALAAEDWWMETLVQLSGIFEDPNWLVRAIAQTNPWLAWWCVQEGKKVDETTRLWIEERSSKLLKSPRVADRRRAVQTLAQTHNERVLPLLLQAVADKDKEVSHYAVRGLIDAGEAARILIKNVLHGRDENLWEAALRYLVDLYWRYPYGVDQLWAEVPEKMWSKLQRSQRELIVKAMSREKGKRFTIPLLKAVGDEDERVSRLALQGLLDTGEEMHLWSEIIGLIKADEKLFSLVHDRLQKLVSFRLAEGGPAIGSLESLSRTLAPLNALERITKNISISQYWHDDFGEPEWVTIPAGNFWMGSENAWGGKPLHELYISEFQIACVPVTNAQYAIYVKDTGALPPKHWPRDKIHVGLESHPVVGVSWYDALAYCKWLGEKTHKIITLPSEAEWEKAARGNEDKREYPWGADYSWQSDLRCNSKELGLNKPQGTTTPVGLFLNGRSPYCVLDMSGNVWEWTRSVRSLQKEGEEIKKEKTFSQRVKLAVANAVPTLPNWLASSLSGEISNAVETKILKEYNYPYDAGDGREDINANSNSPRSLRGGSFSDNSDYARCVYRDKWYSPDYRRNDIGFRVVVTSLIQEHTE